MKNILKSDSELHFGAIETSANVCLNVDNTKLRKSTSWYPYTNFKSGIEKIIKDANDEENKRFSTNI